MPKKSPAARSVAQRNKPKVQKSFELVREASDEENPGPATSAESSSASVATATKVEEQSEKEQAPKGSASARMAARRQAAQKIQQRNAAALITPEHFSYVRRDLTTIAILASVMFIAIIVLYYILIVRA